MKDVLVCVAATAGVAIVLAFASFHLLAYLGFPVLGLTICAGWLQGGVAGALLWPSLDNGYANWWRSTFRVDQ